MLRRVIVAPAHPSGQTEWTPSPGESCDAFFTRMISRPELLDKVLLGSFRLIEAAKSGVASGPPPTRDNWNRNATNPTTLRPWFLITPGAWVETSGVSPRAWADGVRAAPADLEAVVAGFYLSCMAGWFAMPAIFKEYLAEC